MHERHCHKLPRPRSVHKNRYKWTVLMWVNWTSDELTATFDRIQGIRYRRRRNKAPACILNHGLSARQRKLKIPRCRIKLWRYSCIVKSIVVTGSLCSRDCLQTDLNIFSYYNFRSLSVVECVFWITTCRKQSILLQHSPSLVCDSPEAYMQIVFFVFVKLWQITCTSAQWQVSQVATFRRECELFFALTWRSYGFSSAWLPGGVLPYMGYIGMCGPKGYGFSAVLVINWV